MAKCVLTEQLIDYALSAISNAEKPVGLTILEDAMLDSDNSVPSSGITPDGSVTTDSIVVLRVWKEYAMKLGTDSFVDSENPRRYV